MLEERNSLLVIVKELKHSHYLGPKEFSFSPKRFLAYPVMHPEVTGSGASEDEALSNLKTIIRERFTHHDEPVEVREIDLKEILSDIIVGEVISS